MFEVLRKIVYLSGGFLEFVRWVGGTFEILFIFENGEVLPR